jgi:penicillin-binding protein 1A
LTLCFDLGDIHSTSSAQNEQKSYSRYTKTINPVVDMAALAFGIQDLKTATSTGFANLKISTEQNVVEGALISVENQTGYIPAIIGGSRYDESNQLIRATQANVQPGSSFKPLYYSAAIDSKKLTAASLIYDVPIVFHNEDGTPYIPLNFRGEWKGSALLYDALSHSMNVPSLKILDTIGFDAAIQRSSTLLGYTNASQIRQNFPRVYPLGLGIISTSPLRMACAFAVFGNQGRDVTPIVIRTVEDRNGRVVLDPERDLRLQQRRSGNAQVITQENAYIMSKILEKTVEEGTLAHGAGWGSKFTFKDENGKSFRMPVAGKTGTPQNWSDAWALGYSPYYTTAIRFGFDKPGNSPGVELTGSTLAGPVWGDYMREIHQGLSRRDFARPATGIIDVTVCAKSGLLKTPSCNQGDVTLPFLTGTQPTHVCDLHGNNSSTVATINNMRGTTFGLDDTTLLSSLSMPTLPADLFPDLPASRNQNNQNNRNNNTNNNRRNTQNSRNPGRGSQNPISWDFNNPHLDGDDPNPPSSFNSFPQSFSNEIPDEQLEYTPGNLNAAATENVVPQNTADANTPAYESLTQNVPPVSANEASGNGPEPPSYNPLLD